MLSKFCQYLRPVSISLSPNTEKDDVRLALKIIPRVFYRETTRNSTQNYAKQLEEEFAEYLGIKHAISFNSGRSALMAILNFLGLQKDDEILLQAFTCNAAANPIIWTKLKPVYVDVNEKTFNMDVEDLRRKITPSSRVVMVQHTFGLPADTDEILEICQQHDLIFIEDCAHSLGAEYETKKVGLPAEARRAKVGTFGKAAFLSFSRDKVISSVYGGMAVTNDDELAEKLRGYHEKIGYPSYCWTARQILHPILMNWLILPTYRIFGKYLLVLFQWLGILSKAVDWTEKRGRKPSYFPKRMPDALAALALNQLKKLERFNEHRRKIADIYYKELGGSVFALPPKPTDRKQIFLRFAVRHPRAHEIIKNCWQRNLLIGDWYTTPIAPHDTRLDKIYYAEGSCPAAEKLAKETFNLPTYINISQQEAQNIVAALKATTPDLF